MRLASTTLLPALSLFPVRAVTPWPCRHAPFLARGRDRFPWAGWPFARAFAAIRVFSTDGVGTTVPPSRPQVLCLADCHSDAVPILPFPPPFLAGTAGWRHLLRPSGTALLCFPATWDPPRFRSLPKRLAITCPGRRANFFGSSRKSGAWPGEQAPPALWCPARKRGGKGEKTLCIKTAFPSSASSVTTHN